MSDASSPITITYPEASFVNFTDTLTVALVVLLLSRADLQPAKDVSVFQAGVAGSATNLELVASNLLPKMLGKHPEQYYQHENGPSQFRKDILIRARLLANEIANQLGTVPNDTLMRYTELPVTLGGKTLTTVTWAELAPGLGSNLTILESLDVSNGVGGDQTVGLALNPLSNGFMTPAVTRARVGSGSLVLDRAPGFLSAGKSIEPIGTGSADMSPVLYSQAQNKMQFCRNVFLDNTDFLDATILVLQFAGATVIPTATTGDWIQYRLFPQGLPEIEAFLTLIDDFLQGLLTGTRDITAMIVQYIEFIEARILELEALLQRIDALLEMVLQINIPAASGLLVTGEGTMGIVSALTGAQNKPSETETGNVIGGGVVLLAGGLPAPILELFKLFFVQEE